MRVLLLRSSLGGKDPPTNVILTTKNHKRIKLLYIFLLGELNNGRTNVKLKILAGLKKCVFFLNRLYGAITII